MGVVLLTGNEPYRIKCELDRIKKEYGKFGVSEYDELTDAVYEDCGQMSLFGGKKAVVVHCDGMVESDGFLRYVEHPNQSTNLYLVASQIDRRSSVYKACKSGKCGASVVVMDKIPRETFMSMCAGMIKRRGCEVRESTLKKLYDYTGYEENANCNLFDISAVIKQMCYQAGEGGEVTPDMVETFAIAWQEAVIWQLSDVLFSGDKKELLSLGEHLLSSGENPIGMLSTLLRQFRLAYKAKVIGGSEQRLSGALGIPAYRLRKANEYSEQTISRALSALQRRVNDIKGGADAVAVFRAALCETQMLLATP